LRQRDLPLDCTEREPIINRLQEIQREHRSVPAIYANITYLIGALAKMHPTDDWEWLCEWRLDWRRRAWPVKDGRAGSRNLPFAPENSHRWPRQLRQAWNRNWPSTWPIWRDRRYRPAYGLYRAYCRHIGVIAEPERQTLTAYAEFLAVHMPQSVGLELTRLFNALTVLYPDAPWSWLLELKGTVARPSRSPLAETRLQRTPEQSIPFRRWPLDEQRRWGEALRNRGAATRLERSRHRRKDKSFSRRPRKRTRVVKTPDQWRPATLRTAEECYASYLKSASELGANNAAPTEPSVAHWVEGMSQRGLASRSLVNRVAGLRAAMRILYPDQDWAWLERDITILAEEAEPARDKLSRIADIADIRQAAIARMRHIERMPLTPKAALAYQDGLVMLLLSYRPVRCRNLAETRLGINLIFDEAFTQGRLSYHQTKTGVRYEVPLPSAVLLRLRKFVSTYRPMLACDTSSDHAWLSVDGRPLSSHRLCQRIARATEKALGIRITPHLFRDCLATTISEIAPEHIEDAARLLGHHWPSEERRDENFKPMIETYRQRSGSTKAARELATLQANYQIRPRPQKRNILPSD
jgi:integrase/recombinase XerC